MYDAATGRGQRRSRRRTRGSGRGVGGQRKRGTKWAGATTAMIPPSLPPESATAEASSDLEPEISFPSRGKDAMVSAVDTSSLHLLSLTGVISSYSWDCPPHPSPCPCPPVTVPTKMWKSTYQGDSNTAATTVVVRGGTRLGMLTTTVGGVGDKEGRIRRKTVELNWNQTTDRDRA